MQISTVTAAIVLALAVGVTAYADDSINATSAPFGASVCMACHGSHGEGASNGVPRLAGQNAEYMSHALTAFKAGTRASAIMQPITESLGDAEIRRLVDYFSKQTPPVAGAVTSTPPQLMLRGRQLAEMGADDVPACFGCHAAQGKGSGARYPRIAGQPAQYVISRLHDFQARAKGNALQPGTMTAVAATLDERQIAEVAAYLSQLGH